MKNILVVFTGGTIGSQVVQGTIDTSKTTGRQLLQIFSTADHASQAVNFKAIQPLEILSENLRPSDWPLMIAAIEAEELCQFHGIILTHGTDTLAFSAAALGLYFNSLKIPLLLVSSDLPLADVNANGLSNFQAAVAFIRQFSLSGVYVPYKNFGQTLRIYRATRLLSCLPLSGDFSGVQSKSFMTYTDGRFHSQELAERPNVKPIALQANFAARILLIKPYPGLDYRHFNLEGVDAVLHDLYHSGTACTVSGSGDFNNLLEFSQICRQRDIKVYLAPAIKTEQSYRSTQALLAAGLHIIWNTTLEVAYVKLLLAYGNFSDPKAVSGFLEQNIANELI
ncbi:asparaginase [Methylomonas paludis]|uniref:Asparaginase n=1 Tax=Methylomonas paludis TaxID=1173101 RepID=A0A975R9L6_9GAMM|nr:asparaginase domain-containing protein [Methylomonas paludis]QWF71192.1 asparaginase [Methylomonas paludis]